MRGNQKLNFQLAGPKNFNIRKYSGKAVGITDTTILIFSILSNNLPSDCSIQQIWANVVVSAKLIRFKVLGVYLLIRRMLFFIFRLFFFIALTTCRISATYFYGSIFDKNWRIVY